MGCDPQHHELQTHPWGVVLAGGASARMGRDKALLEVDGRTLIARAVQKLEEAGVPVVVARGERAPLPGIRTVPDGGGRGPAAGILGAAHAVAARSGLLVLACDLPLVPVPLLKLLLHQPGDWVVPRWERGIEPLCALYRPAALLDLAQQVQRGSSALHQLTRCGDCRITYLEGEALHRLGRPEDLFLNLNSPDDLARLTASTGTWGQQQQG